MGTALLNPNVDAEEYHAPVLGVCSKSMLDLLARSPAHYRYRLENPKPPTPEMVFGSLTHLYVFEFPKFSERVVVMPDFSGKGSVAARNEWKEAHADKLIVDQEDLDKIRAIGESIHRDKVNAALIGQCQAEVSLFWEDAETGLDCKARLDGLVKPLRTALDLKTTDDASPGEFAYSVWKYRYHVQAAHYSDGFKAATGEDLKTFIFLAVEKSPPFATKRYVLGPNEMARGYELLRRDLATMKRCLDTGEWPGYGDNTETLLMKPWHLRD